MTTAIATADRAAAIRSDPRWAVVMARDPAADSSCFYSVKTTGVFCRPSCAARLARPENVQFHLTATDALRAGFRPCKRCKPDQAPLTVRHAALVSELCRFIEQAERAPSLHQLAKHAGLSNYHLHRIFKAVTGVTPRVYAAAHRPGRVRAALGRSSTITEAIYGAGYNSNGRFYEQSNRLLGMTPTDYRAGGAKTQIRFAIGQCSLRAILVAASARGVCAILLGDDPDALARDLQDGFPRASLIGGNADFEQPVAKVVGLWKHRAWASTCRWTFAARRFSSAPGRHCWLSRPAARSRTPTSPSALVRRRLSGRSPEPAPPIRWQWRFPVTASCASMAAWPATAGAWHASARCTAGRRSNPRYPASGDDECRATTWPIVRVGSRPCGPRWQRICGPHPTNSCLPPTRAGNK